MTFLENNDKIDDISPLAFPKFNQLLLYSVTALLVLAGSIKIACWRYSNKTFCSSNLVVNSKNSNIDDKQDNSKPVKAENIITKTQSHCPDQVTKNYYIENNANE